MQVWIIVFCLYLKGKVIAGNYKLILIKVNSPPVKLYKEVMCSSSKAVLKNMFFNRCFLIYEY